MRIKLVLLSCVLLSGCAFPQQVKRLGVSYNNIIADLGDQLTLLNIERAEEGLPLHYTTFSRIGGGVSVTGGAGFNSAVHGNGVTDTSETDTTTSATPSVVGKVTRALASGGNIYTPSATGSVTTGPSFDVSVLDTQEFYQGILREIPFNTINAFLAEGYRDQLLMHLLVHRIDYVQVDPGGDPAKDKLITSFINEPGRNRQWTVDFEKLVRCLHMRGVAAPPRRLAAFSRIATFNGNPVQLKLDDLAKLDGKTLDISDAISDNIAADAKLSIQRGSSGDRVPVLDYAASKTCTEPDTPELFTSAIGAERSVNLSAASSSELATVKRILTEQTKAGDKTKGAIAALTASGGASVKRYITFRSPEGVIKYLGEYLRELHRDATASPTVAGRYVFSTAIVKTGGLNALSVRVGDHSYTIAKDDIPVAAKDEADDPADPAEEAKPKSGDKNPQPPSAGLLQYRRDLDVLALVQALVNLQKKSDDRLTTVPVEIIR